MKVANLEKPYAAQEKWASSKKLRRTTTKKRSKAKHLIFRKTKSEEAKQSLP